MAIKNAKCTQCGANIHVDDTKEAGICGVCGAAFITEKAIRNYQSFNSLVIGGMTITSDEKSIELDDSMDSEETVEIEDHPPICLMVVEEVFSISGRGTVVTGKIENGTIAVNETVTINNQSFAVIGIEQFGKLLNSASVGMAVGILLRGATKDSFQAGDTVYKSVRSQGAVATPDAIAKELLDAGYQNRKLEAIKILREKTGLSLAEAKNVIESVFEGTEKGSPAPAAQSGGCYVATCVYGSYNCPQVWTLRRYRDNVLASTWYGRLFIRTYYAVSPTLVRWFGDTNWFKKLWKGKLDRMVAELQAKGFENTPYEDKAWQK